MPWTIGTAGPTVVIVVIDALEIVDVDYTDEALAPAIVGWAAEEFGFTNRPVDIRFDDRTKQFVVSWTTP